MGQGKLDADLLRTDPPPPAHCYGSMEFLDDGKPNPGTRKAY